LIAHRLALEHLVERRGAQHLGRCDADELGDVLHGLLAEVTVLLLRQVQERDQRRAALGVAGDDVVGDGRVVGGEPGHQRAPFICRPHP
jgi:hypothetical protein